MKKTSTILMTTAILFSTTLPIMANGVSAAQVKTPATENQQNNFENRPSSNFINKFDQSIKMSGNKFIIDTNNLPENTTSEELTKLNELISQKNSIISSSENLNNGTKITKESNFIIISDTDNGSMLRFREGSNYVHVYWWGLRIGISRTALHAIGAGITIGTIWIPEPTITKVLATLGVLAGVSPGGIVFNSTPPIATFWGSEFQ